MLVLTFCNLQYYAFPGIDYSVNIPLALMVIIACNLQWWCFSGRNCCTKLYWCRHASEWACITQMVDRWWQCIHDIVWFYNEHIQYSKHACNLELPALHDTSSHAHTKLNKLRPCTCTVYNETAHLSRTNLLLFWNLVSKSWATVYCTKVMKAKLLLAHAIIRWKLESRVIHCYT